MIEDAPRLDSEKAEELREWGVHFDGFTKLLLELCRCTDVTGMKIFAAISDFRPRGTFLKGKEPPLSFLVE
jgi:hypothetical protein